MIPIIGAIVGAVSNIASSWLETRKIKAQGKIEIEKAKVNGEIKRINSITEGEIQYDVKAQEGMRYSWKDEFFVLLLATPFVMSFIPQLAPYVKEGFEVLKTSTPDWYQWAFLGAIVASFGLRTWFNKLKGLK